MIAALVTLILSMLFGGLYLRIAHSRQILDTPDERSSHTLPTPSGGGAALILAFVFGLIVAVWLYDFRSESLVILTLAGLVFAGLGFIDDLRSLSMWLRLAIYSLLCLLIAFFLLQPVISETGLHTIALILFSALAMLWSLNLYNFMDGIDGIAATQSVLACSFAALISWGPQNNSYALYCLLLAAAHGGFLIWNYPPAKLFMGDAGSVTTGFLLAGLAIIGGLQGHIGPACWIVLLAVFITDASWTLLWRIGAGQRFTEPHRLHAYQRLSRHWNSHLKVDLLLVLINLCWLFPIALAVQQWPVYAPFLVILAYLPLLCGVAKMRRLA